MYPKTAAIANALLDQPSLQPTPVARAVTAALCADGIPPVSKILDTARLGVSVTHMSNAGLTKRNPGANSVVLMYSVPLR